MMIESVFIYFFSSLYWGKANFARSLNSDGRLFVWMWLTGLKLTLIFLSGFWLNNLASKTKGTKQTTHSFILVLFKDYCELFFSLYVHICTEITIYISQHKKKRNFNLYLTLSYRFVRESRSKLAKTILRRTAIVYYHLKIP